MWYIMLNHAKTWSVPSMMSVVKCFLHKTMSFDAFVLKDLNCL